MVDQDICPACGAANRSGARFCGGCGRRLTDSPVPEASVPAAPPPPPPDPPAPRPAAPAQYAEAEHVSAPKPAAATLPGASAAWSPAVLWRDHRPLVVAGGAIIGLLLVILATVLMRGDGEVSRPTPQVLYVTRLVRMRDGPTSLGTAVLENLVRGQSVTGVWITGGDGVTPWLKVERTSGGTGYVWGQNLSPIPRPVLTRPVDEVWSLGAGGEIRIEPSDSAALVDTLAAGTQVQVTGELEGGWLEIALRRGGVGYMRSPPPAPALDQTLAAGPSFDCAMAVNWTERTICANAALSGADRRIAALYDEAQAQPQSNTAREMRLADQRAWIAERNRCETSSQAMACLRSIYQHRAAELGLSGQLF